MKVKIFLMYFLLALTIAVVILEIKYAILAKVIAVISTILGAGLLLWALGEVDIEKMD